VQQVSQRSGNQSTGPGSAGCAAGLGGELGDAGAVLLVDQDAGLSRVTWLA
jgi:hypothetical protein